MRSSARRVLRNSVPTYPSLPQTARWPQDSAAPAYRLPPAPVAWISAHSKPDDQAGASAYSRPLWNFKPALHRRSCQATLEPGRDASKAIERHEFACAVKADQIAHPAEQRDVGDRVLVLHHPPPSIQASLHHPEQARGFGDIALKRRLVAGPVRIDDRRDLAVRVQRQEFRRLLVVLVEIDEMHFVRQPDLLQHDRDLDAVWRRKRIELKAVRIFCGPARGNRKGGKDGHEDRKSV